MIAVRLRIKGGVNLCEWETQKHVYNSHCFYNLLVQDYINKAEKVYYMIIGQRRYTCDIYLEVWR